MLDIIDSIDPADLVVAIKNAPSLRGMILGYIAEVMFQKHILEPHAKISKIREFDDHNRQENKADRAFELDGKIITVQLKSIQTTTIKWDNLKNCLTANVQNDGSDKRDVKLPNGNTVSPPIIALVTTISLRCLCFHTRENGTLPTN